MGEAPAAYAIGAAADDIFSIVYRVFGTGFCYPDRAVRHGDGADTSLDERMPMTRRRSVRVATCLAFSVLMLAGCGKPDTLGTAIRGQGQELAAIGDRWSEGDDLIEEGREQIDDGNEMIDDGHDLIREGEKNMERGKAMKLQAEEDYRVRTGKELPTLSP